MTEAQTEAVVKIKDIMREHFECGVVVVCAYSDLEEEGTETRVAFHGGYVPVIGLVEQARNRLRQQDNQNWSEAEEME